MGPVRANIYHEGMFKLIGHLNPHVPYDRYCSQEELRKNEALHCVRPMLPATKILKFRRQSNGKLEFQKPVSKATDRWGYLGKFCLLLNAHHKP